MPASLPETPKTHTVRFLFSLWKISPLQTSLLIVMQSLFALLTAAVAPLFVAKLLSHISDGSATFENSQSILIAYLVVLFIGDVVAVRAAIFLSFRVVTKMQATVYRRVLSNLMEKDITFHSNRMSGGVVSDATKLHGAIERFWDTIAYSAVPVVVTIVSVCLALVFILWQYAAVLLLLSIITIYFIIKAQNRIAPYSKESSKRGSAVVAYFADVISNIATVKSFAGEKVEHKAFNDLIQEWTKASHRQGRSVVAMTASFGSMLTVMNIFAFIAAVIATEYKLGNVAVTYLVIVYTLNVVAQLWSVSNLTRSYIRIIGDAAPMIDILNTPPMLDNPLRPEPARINKGKIVFDRVSFTHDENNDVLFNDFSLMIKPGSRVGLVGHSGSGKTSLTRLLLRFSDIDDGAITIDGQAINMVTQSDLRNHIAYVPQEPLLFHRSLRDNIAYGNPDATHEQISAAARQAYALEFIEKLPQGFDTLVGERGVKLSGGQRQRIAIARAILKDAPILILDEATSALDSESEKLIQQSLETLMKGRTSIVIAHRLSTIAKLDRIIVLENGKIIEDGTHAELLNKKGTYAKLWSHQSGGFIEE